MSKQLTDIEVRHIAKLANLILSEKEIELFTPQLVTVLEYIDKLSEVNTTFVEPTSQVTGLANVERNDVTTPSLPQEKALSNVKAEKGLFRVRAIFHEQD